MINSLKITKIIAWLAFGMYVASLFLPYAKFNIPGGDSYTGIKLRLFILLIITIPLVIFFYTPHSIIMKFTTLLLSSILATIGVILIIQYIGFSDIYPIKLGIGMPLYLMMAVLFLIASILKFLVPIKKMPIQHPELIDNL